jgi:hypothetical protein
MALLPRKLTPTTFYDVMRQKSHYTGSGDVKILTIYSLGQRFLTCGPLRELNNFSQLFNKVYMRKKIKI